MKTLRGSSYQLSDLLEGMPGGPELAFRDFALVTIAGQLSECFPRQLVFKGGFVLRHVHGFLRSAPMLTRPVTRHLNTSSTQTKSLWQFERRVSGL